MKQSIIVLQVFIVFSVSVINAQDKHPDLQRELILEKEYNPTLRDANKINRLPEIKAPEAPPIQVEFSNYTLDFHTSPSFQSLGIINYFPRFVTSDKRGYVHLGMSTAVHADGDIGYQILNDGNDRLSIFASHRSNNSTVAYLQNREKQKMKLNDNFLGIGYDHRFTKVRLTADAKYGYSAFNDYGLFSVGDSNRVNNRLQIHTGIESVRNNDVNYKANLAYTWFGQIYLLNAIPKYGSENRISADLDLYAKFIGIAGSIKNYSYALPKGADWIVDDFFKIFDNVNYTTFSLSPYLFHGGDNWGVRWGASVHIQLGGVTKFLTAPDIRFHWRPADQVLFYLLAGGGIQDNSHYNSRSENRYMAPAYRVLDAKSPLDANAGLDFTLVPQLKIGLFTGYKWTNDEHFDLPPNKLVYAKTGTFKWGGSLKYAYPDIFDMELRLTCNQWQVKELLFAFSTFEPFYLTAALHKPVVVGDLNVGFKMPDIPFLLNLTYHLEVGRKTLDNNLKLLDMKNIHDMNFTGTYTLNETVSVYAKLNNLLFQKYDLWYGYPAQSFNMMGGINIKF